MLLTYAKPRGELTQLRFGDLRCYGEFEDRELKLYLQMIIMKYSLLS